MSIRFLREEIRTDAVGTYRAYLYADGHTETDPPGRPLSREDLQRKRLNQAVNARPGRMADSIRTKRGSRTAALQRELGDTPPIRALMQGFHDTVNACDRLGKTARAPKELRVQLVRNADLGGPVRNRDAGREYGIERPLRTIKTPKRSNPVPHPTEHR